MTASLHGLGEAEIPNLQSSHPDGLRSPDPSSQKSITVVNLKIDHYITDVQ